MNTKLIVNEQFTETFDHLYELPVREQDERLTEIKNGVIQSVITQAQLYGKPTNHYLLYFMGQQELAVMVQITGTVMPHLKSEPDVVSCFALLKAIKQIFPDTNLKSTLQRFRSLSPLAQRQEIEQRVKQLLS